MGGDRCVLALTSAWRWRNVEGWAWYGTGMAYNVREGSQCDSLKG